ncbi:MAG: hypothetical protein ACF8TS_19575 [Maioricimonas sp. JB049]
MSPFDMLSLFPATQQSENFRTAPVRPTAAARRADVRAGPRRDSRRPRTQWQELGIRFAIIFALMMTFLVGLILLAFTL